MKEETKENLKTTIINHLEILTKEAVNFVFDLIIEAVNSSNNKIDDMFLPILNSLKPIILKQVEKMDGK